LASGTIFISIKLNIYPQFNFLFLGLKHKMLLKLSMIHQCETAGKPNSTM